MLDFFNKKENMDEKRNKLKRELIPNHIAIIMDGNGRWAKKRHLPRIAGHKQGMKNCKKYITKVASNLGVKVPNAICFFYRKLETSLIKK